MAEPDRQFDYRHESPRLVSFRTRPRAATRPDTDSDRPTIGVLGANAGSEFRKRLSDLTLEGRKQDVGSVLRKGAAGRSVGQSSFIASCRLVTKTVSVCILVMYRNKLSARLIKPRHGALRRSKMCLNPENPWTERGPKVMVFRHHACALLAAGPGNDQLSAIDGGIRRH
jgi:hypothetical protein